MPCHLLINAGDAPEGPPPSACRPEPVEWLVLSLSKDEAVGVGVQKRQALLPVLVTAHNVASISMIPVQTVTLTVMLFPQSFLMLFQSL